MKMMAVQERTACMVEEARELFMCKVGFRVAAAAVAAFK